MPDKITMDFTIFESIYCFRSHIDYEGDMDSSLQRCLKYKKQDSPEKNRRAAWQELEHLAAVGKLLLFVDNVNIPLYPPAQFL